MISLTTTKKLGRQLSHFSRCFSERKHGNRYTWRWGGGQVYTHYLSCMQQELPVWQTVAQLKTILTPRDRACESGSIMGLQRLTLLKSQENKFRACGCSISSGKEWGRTQCVRNLKFFLTNSSRVSSFGAFIYYRGARWNKQIKMRLFRIPKGTWRNPVV